MSQPDPSIALAIALTALVAMLLILTGVVEMAWIYVRAVCDWWSYKIRPYDDIADRRRWFWRRREPCGYRRRRMDGRP